MMCWNSDSRLILAGNILYGSLQNLGSTGRKESCFQQGCRGQGWAGPGAGPGPWRGGASGWAGPRPGSSSSTSPPCPGRFSWWARLTGGQKLCWGQAPHGSCPLVKGKTPTVRWVVGTFPQGCPGRPGLVLTSRELSCGFVLASCELSCGLVLASREPSYSLVLALRELSCGLVLASRDPSYSLVLASRELSYGSPVGPYCSRSVLHSAKSPQFWMEASAKCNPRGESRGFCKHAPPDIPP